MKQLFIEIVERDFNGDYDAYTAEQARQTCEEFIPDEDTLCPNCFGNGLERNETEARCVGCGQEFVYVGPTLRFK